MQFVNERVTVIISSELQLSHLFLYFIGLRKFRSTVNKVSMSKNALVATSNPLRVELGVVNSVRPRFN